MHARPTNSKALQQRYGDGLDVFESLRGIGRQARAGILNLDVASNGDQNLAMVGIAVINKTARVQSLFRITYNHGG